MTEFNVEKFIDDLKSAGYFKQYDDSSRGNIYRYNGIYGDFQELNNDQFRQLLERIIGNVNANEYWYYIKTNLNVFPTKEHNQYMSYIKYSKERSLESVEREFLNGFYKDNANRKKETEITPNVDSTKDVQVLINNDIFTNGVSLYKYDSDDKTFILVNEDNIGTFINCNDKDIANKILETGLKYKSLLINVFFTMDLFKNAKDVEFWLKANENGYRYITKLKENINVKYEDTFGIMFY